MKINILILLQLVAFSTFAQKGFKLYAYQQEVSGGASKMVADPNGNTMSTGQKQVNYRFYLELTGDKMPEIREVWISGKLYDGKLKEITSPVTIHQKMTIEKDPSPDTLVRTTTNKIYQLLTTPSANPEKKTNKASKQNEVCLIYTYNGKKYKTEKPMQTLARVVNQ